MRAGDGVGNRLTVQNRNRDFVRRVRVDGISGIRITNTVGSQFRCANLDGQTVACPEQETLGDVIGRGINIDDCSGGRCCPVDCHRFPCSNTNLIIAGCRNAHAKHGYEHRGNQKQGKHFLGCFHDLFSF